MRIRDWSSDVCLPIWATSLSIASGVAMMAWYFARLENYVAIDRRQLRPQWTQWRRIFRIGLPPGGEFALMFVYMGVIYAVIGGFGAAAQAGFGVGSRVMQAIFLPAIAVAFACSPIAAQNVGDRKSTRLNSVTNAHLVCRLLLEKKKKKRCKDKGSRQ